jgi:large subunit ribosomal protein L32e
VTTPAKAVKDESPPQREREALPPPPPAKKKKESPAAEGAAEPETTAAPKKRAKASDAPPAPRRPTLEPETARLMRVRAQNDRRRPKFTRQASYRYYRIGRWNSWRRPRGLQSKQRRHYGYRSTIVSIGFGSPRATRGLTPTGFRPVVVRTPKEIESLDARRDAAVIARTVGTKKRLVLEEKARQKGIHVLNPLVTGGEET